MHISGNLLTKDTLRPAIWSSEVDCGTEEVHSLLMAIPFSKCPLSDLLFVLSVAQQIVVKGFLGSWMCLDLHMRLFLHAVQCGKLAFSQLALPMLDICYQLSMAVAWNFQGTKMFTNSIYSI